jgi:type IV pilus assembly protein PilQ
MIRLHRLALAAALAAAPSIAAAAPPDAEVTAVSVVSAPGRADLVIDVHGAIQVRDFTLANPARLVLDLTGARLSPAMRAAYDGMNRAGIVNVRYSQFAPGVVRVVLELDAVREYSVERSDAAVRVSFGADRAFLAWSSTSPGAAVLAAQPDAASAPRAVRAREVTPPSGAPLRQSGQEPRMTVTWDNADIADVVAGFAAFSGRSIILGKDITGTVSAEIKDQPWPAALGAVLAAQGLSAQEMPGGIIRVDSPAALSALDSLEPLQTQLVRLNYAKAAEVAKSTEGILTKGRGSVVPDTASNSLIITETRSRLDRVSDFVRRLDVRTPQVSIQAKIIFVDRTDLMALGFQYDLGDENQFFNQLVQRQDPNGDPGETFEPNVNVIDLGGNAVSAIANANSEINGSALDLVWSTALGGFSLTTFLSALQRVDLADIQAEPLITTLDNRKADILVGEETPVRIVDYSSVATGGAPRATVQFKETGIRLTVTPRVTNNGQILMELETERSAVQTLAAADLGFNIQTQRATNQLLVQDGETAVIGGLTVTSVTRTRSGIPLLSGLPIVGGLFSFTSNEENRKDLIILVTPRILDDATDAPAE